MVEYVSTKMRREEREQVSTSYHIQGIKPPDETWKKMKAVYDACTAANIDIPDDVCAYFNDEEPDDKGVVVDVPYEEWQADSSSGYDIDLTKLPFDVKIVRFSMSW